VTIGVFLMRTFDLMTLVDNQELNYILKAPYKELFLYSDFKLSNKALSANSNMEKPYTRFNEETGKEEGEEFRLEYHFSD